MPRYLLDTDTCSCIMRRSPESVIERIAKTPVNEVCISVISKSELLYGVEVSPKRRQDEAAVAAFLAYIEVLDFPDEASTHYAKIRADLKKQGTTFGANNLLIAAHARSLGLTLITNNTAEFKRIRGLSIENWAGE